MAGKRNLHALHGKCEDVHVGGVSVHACVHVEMHAVQIRVCNEYMSLVGEIVC